MTVLIVSDVHYEHGAHHGIDESGAAKWLLNVAVERSPSDIIGLGDFGHAWTTEEWQKILNVAPANVIYGNHDNLEVLQSMKNYFGSRIWVKDGGLREVDGALFGFINGIVALKGEKKIKDGVPRTSPQEYIHAAQQLRGADFLCTHESPYLQQYGTLFHYPSLGFETVKEAIEIARPKVVFSGHLSGPYAIGKLGDILAIRVDSSPAEKHFALLEPKSRKIEIWNDRTKVDETSY